MYCYIIWYKITNIIAPITFHSCSQTFPLSWTTRFCQGTAPSPWKYSINFSRTIFPSIVALRPTTWSPNNSPPVCRHSPGAIFQSEAISDSKHPSDWEYLLTCSLRKNLCSAVHASTIVSTVSGGKLIGAKNTRNLFASIPNPFSTVRRPLDTIRTYPLSRCLFLVWKWLHNVTLQRERIVCQEHKWQDLIAPR